MKYKRIFKKLRIIFLAMSLLFILDVIFTGNNTGYTTVKADEEYIQAVLNYNPPYAGNRELAAALKALSVSEELNEESLLYLQTVAIETESELPEVKRQFLEVLKIKKDRENQPYRLTWLMDNHWASLEQMMSGKIVGSYFNLDPWAGVLLNETGGSIGPGGGLGTLIFQVNLNDINIVVNHSVFHDAYGYLYNYHNYIGPGYIYGASSDSYAPVSTEHPLSGHLSGLLTQTRYQEQSLIRDIIKTAEFFSSSWRVCLTKVVFYILKESSKFIQNSNALGM